MDRYPGTTLGSCTKCGSTVVIREGVNYEPGCLRCFMIEVEEKREKRAEDLRVQYEQYCKDFDRETEIVIASHRP